MFKLTELGADASCCAVNVERIEYEIIFEDAELAVLWIFGLCDYFLGFALGRLCGLWGEI